MKFYFTKMIKPVQTCFLAGKRSAIWKLSIVFDFRVKSPVNYEYKYLDVHFIA